MHTIEELRALANGRFAVETVVAPDPTTASASQRDLNRRYCRRTGHYSAVHQRDLHTALANRR